MIELPAFALAALMPVVASGAPMPAWPGWSGAGAGPTAPASYDPEARAVSNWRAATRGTLEPAPLAAAASLFVSGRPVVTRCVKLNNPWCIKRARWTGEIGSDDEGHTAFASTEAGADAAAALLRTYYVGSGRRSALDIVRRWAPAECRLGDGIGLSATLAVRGLANTLRARFLAGRTRTGTAQPGKPNAAAPKARASMVPLPRMPTYRVPSIASGMGERGAAPKPVTPRPAVAVAQPKLAPAPRVRTASLGAMPAMPSPSLCGTEEGRIQYYAIAISRALGVAPADDLRLFTEAGAPTENLLPVLVAMSAVELGYLHAGPELVSGAIERLRAKLAREAEPTPAPVPPG